MEKPLKNHLIQHFSHEHLLEHRLLPPEENCICFGCKLEVSPGKLCYKCKTCPFYLHQVCYNMPQKVQHPADPNHHLTLLALPSSNQKYIECEACQQSIAGFYYNCAICGTFYHMLCLGTPLSVKLPVHPHKLDLEFSPPYKFQCDLCLRPSHEGWLYRCGLCEVDVHISCAIMDSQDKLQLQTAATRSLSCDEKRGGDRKFHELMELLLQGIMDTQDKQVFQSQLTSMSDNIATPSVQFSDACFSIDIEQSFTGGSSANAEADLLQKVEESEETRKMSCVVITKGTVQDSKQANYHPVHSHTKTPSFGSYVGGPQKSEEVAILPAKSKQVWVELGQKIEQTQVKASSNAGLQHHAEKSDSVRMNPFGLMHAPRGIGIHKILFHLCRVVGVHVGRSF